MEWFFIIVVGAVILYWVASSSRKSKRVQSRFDATAEPSGLTIKVTSSTSQLDRRGDQKEVDVGAMAPAGERAWVLNPKSRSP